MPILNMPNVGEGVTEGTVTRWLKREGDSVARDEPVVEVETDKAVVEIPSPYAGRLGRILVQEGETVPVGEPIAEFVGEHDQDGGGNGGRSVSERHDVESSRPARAPSIEGSGGPAGTHAEPAVPSAPSAGEPERASSGVPGMERSRFYSPVVLRLAEEHGLDLSAIDGSGAGGRVTRADVMRAIEGRAPEAPPAERSAEPAAAPHAPAAPATPPGDAEMRALSATRRSIARHMSESHATIPVAWMVVEADVTGLVALRAGAREEFERTNGVRLSYMPFFIQSVVEALKRHPELNATYGDDGVLVHRRYDLGLAVATPSGLLVPVLRDADRKSLAAIATEIEDLGERARERRLSLDELRGGTFTLDNTGAFGSILSQPIVPMGQVAILTTESIRREIRPIGDEDAFGVRSVMNLCVSFDHRALDGAEVGEFMFAVRERLEAYQPGQAVH